MIQAESTGLENAASGAASASRRAVWRSRRAIPNSHRGCPLRSHGVAPACRSCQTAAVEKPAAESEATALELAGDHRLLVARTDQGHCVRIVPPGGATAIVIDVTSQGITLRVDGPEIAIHASGALSLSADQLRLEGRRGVAIASGGDLEIAVAGDARSHARAHLVRAEAGTVAVKASDDVTLSGERVMVNCDETVDRYFREPSALDRRPSTPAIPAPTPPPATAKTPG
jgi:hypothetical protein